MDLGSLGNRLAQGRGDRAFFGFNAEHLGQGCARAAQVQAALPGQHMRPGFRIMIHPRHTFDDHGQDHVFAFFDSLPPEVDYLLGTTSETLPAGIYATLEFDDGTDSWTYAPVSQGCGAATGSDRCVRAIRWTLDTPLPATAPDNAAVFRFTAGIR